MRTGLAIVLPLCAAFAAATASNATQAPAPAPGEGQSATAVQPEALALARLTTPAEMTVESEVRAARQAFVTGFRSEPNGVALEAAHPNILEEIWAALGPEIERSSREALPGFVDKVALLYADRLTAPEIRALTAFYTTPTGQKVIAGMYRNMDVDPLVAEALGNDEGRVSGATALAAVDAAAGKTVRDLTAEDHRAAAVLQRSISMDKLARIGTEVQKLALDDANAPNPELDARLGKIVEDVVRRYTGK